MSSQALQHWRSVRLIALNEIETAQARVGGTGPGRRYATQQINHAYAVLLSSQFQGFCRDLHSEAVDLFVQGIHPIELRLACRNSLMLNRKLSQGNPNPGNLGSDFNRLGLNLWDEARRLDARAQASHTCLENLNLWRNAIAHQDFRAGAIGSMTLRIQAVRAWRNACDRIANTFDEVMRQHLRTVLGVSPW